MLWTSAVISHSDITTEPTLFSPGLFKLGRDAAGSTCGGLQAFSHRRSCRNRQEETGRSAGHKCLQNGKLFHLRRDFKRLVSPHRVGVILTKTLFVTRHAFSQQLLLTNYISNYLSLVGVSVVLLHKQNPPLHPPQMSRTSAGVRGVFFPSCLSCILVFSQTARALR